MSLQTSGIHHITAIVGHPQENFAFYTNILGLRLVKKTVNFDQPDVYHLYYGNEVGEPGTLLTFFPLLKGLQRRPSEVAVTSFAVPTGAFTYWEERFHTFQINYISSERFGSRYLSIKDPHGLKIELVEKDLKLSPWQGTEIPAPFAIRGFAGLTLHTISIDTTATSLTQILGMKKAGIDGKYVRYKTQSDIGSEIDVLEVEEGQQEKSVGFVHHVAWRAESISQLEEWQKHASTYNSKVTKLKDRNYFTSIYFREADTILHEIATDPPGFAVDEPKKSLGQSLKLPQWLEKDRQKIEAGLPEIKFL